MGAAKITALPFALTFALPGFGFLSRVKGRLLESLMRKLKSVERL